MATGTPGRGKTDTASAARVPAAIRFPLSLVSSRRVFIATALVAALLHMPFLPSGFFGLLQLDNDLTVDDYESGEAFLPIELDIAPPAEPPADRDERAGDDGEPGEQGGIPQDIDPPAPEGALDAGVDAPDEQVADAAPDEPDAAPDEPDAAPDAAIDDPDAGVADAGPPAPERIKSPLDVAGTQDLTKHPNVQVLLVGKNMRSHPIGRTLGSVFSAIPEWRSFFEGTSVDPIQDFETLTIAGPQFRNSSEVSVVIQYGAEFSKMKGAVDHIVDKTKGEWLKGKPVRHVARAKADRAQRLFAFVEQKKLLYILPVSLEDQLAGLHRRNPPSTRTNAAIVVGLIDPGRPFGKAFPIPKSIRWLGLTVIPTPEGGADVLLQLDDASAAEAALHAPEITQAFNDLRSQLKWEVGVGMLKVGFSVEDVLDRVEFVADDRSILARTQVSQQQLSKLITAINVWLSFLGTKK